MLHRIPQNSVCALICWSSREDSLGRGVSWWRILRISWKYAFIAFSHAYLDLRSFLCYVFFSSVFEILSVLCFATFVSTAQHLLLHLSPLPAGCSGRCLVFCQLWFSPMGEQVHVHVCVCDGRSSLRRWISTQPTGGASVLGGGNTGLRCR